MKNTYTYGKKTVKCLFFKYQDYKWIFLYPVYYHVIALFFKEKRNCSVYSINLSFIHSFMHSTIYWAPILYQTLF